MQRCREVLDNDLYLEINEYAHKMANISFDEGE